MRTGRWSHSEHADGLYAHAHGRAKCLLLRREWTPLKVRREVEERLSLEEGSLDEKPYKSAVKTAIQAAMVRVSDSAV